MSRFWPLQALALVAGGLLLGVFSGLTSTARIMVGTVAIPVGLVVTIAALVPIVRACAWAVQSQWGALLVGVGWLASTLALGTQWPSGDFLLGSDRKTMIYVSAATMLLTAASVFPLIARDEPAASGQEVRQHPAPPPTISQ